MKDLGYNEKGEISKNVNDEEDILVEEAKEESGHSVNNGSIHKVNKVGDSTLDSLDREIEI
jgi:hypothetical protein